jgi:UDP-N-acetylmuramoyl-tripeptide--D-alanyl-D-alanine ligase
MDLQWSTARICQILGIRGPDTDRSVKRVITDSREILPGDLFVAIRGDTHDGHHHIASALSAGAVAALSEEDSPGPDPRILRVPSTLSAIRKLAGYRRSQFRIPVIGVVGAVGKTTTKELLASLLRGRFKSVLKTEGSQNGFLGIAITLLRLSPEDEAAVIEIGIDEIGAMEQHFDLVLPTHVVLTRTGPEHLHQLKTVEIAAKEELKAFDHALKHGLPLAVNLSDPFVRAWFQKHGRELSPGQALTFAFPGEESTDLKAQTTETGLRIEGPGFRAELPCPLPGEHHAANLLAAVTVCRFLEMPESELISGLTTFKTALGRTEMHERSDGTILIGDHYNSNPASLEAALRLLASLKPSGRLHAVLGDMLELGDEEERYHREMASVIRELRIDRVWLYGKRMAWLSDELEKTGFSGVLHLESHEALLEMLRPELRAGDRVLVKGSRGMRMEKVLSPLLKDPSPA